MEGDIPLHLNLAVICPRLRELILTSQFGHE